MTTTNAYLHFDGTQTSIEIPSSTDLSIATTGELTVSAWIRPETLTFARTEGSGYVHWLGKGERGQHEWTFRIYSQDNTDDRGNRISFYVFNPEGGLGVGSYFQDALQAGQWLHVVGVVDRQSVAIYRDGIRRDSDVYTGTIVPQAGSAPLRIGTRDRNSFFQGEIREVRLWNRRLTDDEIAQLHSVGVVPPTGLIAEYLLTQDIAPDSAGSHPGAIYAPTWILADEASEPMAVAAEAQRIVDHVQVTEYQHHTEIDEATGTYRTDCSGFASYVLQRVAPAHLAMIPKEPDHAHPRAFKYHAYFSSLQADQAGWHAVRHLVNVRRGDIIAWRHPDPIQPGEDTGHVLVVAARPTVETADTYSVHVYDASHDHHNADTRAAGVTGVGSGTIRLQVDGTGFPVAFQFKIGDQFHTYPIAIGRLAAL